MVRSTDYDERYTFTGKEKDSETGYYYHGARYYDPTTVTGWTTVDPMLDKYLDISPYAYCAWNPMKYVDPDGREIIFDPKSQKIVDEFRNITQDLLEGFSCTEEQRKEYTAALNELSVLENSEQMYHIQDIGSTYNQIKGGTYYNSKDNSICIDYNGQTANLAHELKHAYQFEIGELSFKKTGKSFGELYDINDEVDAHKRGGAYDNKQLGAIRNIENTYRFRIENDKEHDYYYPFRATAPNRYSTAGNKRENINISTINNKIDLSNDIFRSHVP